MIKTRKDFEKGCRCCLTMNGAMTNMFDSSLNNLLENVSGFRAVPEDGLPSTVCTRCCLKISAAYNFKSMVTKTLKLLNYIMDHNEIQSTADITSHVIAAENHDHAENTQTYSPSPIKKEDGNDLEEKLICPESPKSYGKKIKVAFLDHQIHAELDPSCDKTVLKYNMSPHLTPPSKAKATSECQICVTNRDYLTKDETGCSKTGMPYLCSYCGKKFKWNSSYHKHVRYHTKKNMHYCQYCMKEFLNKSTLDTHELSHVGLRFKCVHCKKDFSQKSALNKHVRNFHNNRLDQEALRKVKSKGRSKRNSNQQSPNTKNQDFCTVSRNQDSFPNHIPASFPQTAVECRRVKLLPHAKIVKTISMFKNKIIVENSEEIPGVHKSKEVGTQISAEETRTLKDIITPTAYK